MRDGWIVAVRIVLLVLMMYRAIQGQYDQAAWIGVVILISQSGGLWQR